MHSQLLLTLVRSVLASVCLHMDILIGILSMAYRFLLSYELIPSFSHLFVITPLSRYLSQHDTLYLSDDTVGGFLCVDLKLRPILLRQLPVVPRLSSAVLSHQMTSPKVDIIYYSHTSPPQVHPGTLKKRRTCAARVQEYIRS